MISVHLAGCIAALLLGGLVAWLPKGTPVHRLLGWCYVLATVVYAGSALTIFPSTGHFTPFHAIAVQSFALVGLGIGAARAMSRCSTVWRVWHLRFMVYSYVALAATGLRFGLPYLAGGRAAFLPDRRSQNVAVGFTGDPDPPGAGSAVTVSRNVQRLSRAATCATSSRSATSMSGIPSELIESR